MAEYIERNKIYELIGQTGVKMVHVSDIDVIPCADVAPVRHGRWEEADWVEPDCHGFGIARTPKEALRCSNCKNCFKKEFLWKDNFCPNCGAKMDGGDS